ncbi:MAG: SRPBCC family protein [Odoribacteraceae bacterium]|jgi:hypothetical protein|nr:SRPBCC family protein [Odoribacteraceae bacterium]
MDTKIVSEIKKIECDIASVYKFYSDCNHLGNVARTMSAQRSMEINDFQSTADTFAFAMPGFGNMELRIEERVEPTLVKFAGSEMSPFKFQLYVQLQEHAPYDTRMHLTFEAKLGAIRMMLKGKMEKMINQMVTQLAVLPYPSMI